MKDESLHEQFYMVLNRFRKLHLGKMVPEVSKMEFFVLEQMLCLKEKEENSQGVYVSQLVQRTHMAPPAVSRLLKGLEERGYVVRESDKKNRRNTYVNLTPSGEEICLEIHQRMEQYLDRVFEKVGKENIREMFAIWDQVLDCMAEEVDEI